MSATPPPDNTPVSDEAAQKPHTIQLTASEIQSGFDRVRWAEGLIRQLPDTHDGRNSWLLNYGTGPHDWPAPHAHSWRTKPGSNYDECDCGAVRAFDGSVTEPRSTSPQPPFALLDEVVRVLEPLAMVANMADEALTPDDRAAPILIRTLRAARKILTRIEQERVK